MKSIYKLKQLIANASILMEPLHYFFDLVEGKVLLNTKGYKIITHVEHHIELLTVMKAVQYGASQQLNKPLEVVSQAFFEMPGEHFYHGICMIKEVFLPVTVLYCSDIQVGIFCITENHKNDALRFILARETDLQKTH